MRSLHQFFIGLGAAIFVAIFSDVTSAVASNKALQFSGSQAVVIPHDSTISFSSSSQLTIELWFMPTQLPGIYHIIGKREACTEYLNNYQFARDWNSLLSLNSGGDIVSAGIDPVANQWYHMAITYDGLILRMYINGTNVFTTPYTITGENTTTLLIGGSTCGQNFVGHIDEVRIWRVCRTSAEMAAYYNRPVYPHSPGLVGYWNFDEDSLDQHVFDVSGTGNDGTLGASLDIDYYDPTRVLSTAPLVDDTRDVEVSQIVSPDTAVAVFAEVIPTALVVNKGVTTETVPLTCRIGLDYSQDTSVVLAAGETLSVAFAPWYNTEAGSYPLSCFASLEGDVNRANDTVSSVVVTFTDPEAPSLYSISPGRGGNTGRVTITVTGTRFQLGAHVVLRSPSAPDVVSDSPYTFVDSPTRLRATFFFNAATLGAYDVWVINPDGRGGRYASGFILEEARQHLWQAILGRLQVRRGRPFEFNVEYGNSGNVDAENVSILVRVPALAGISTWANNPDSVLVHDPISDPPDADSEEIVIEAFVGDVSVGESSSITCLITWNNLAIDTFSVGADIFQTRVLLTDGSSPTISLSQPSWFSTALPGQPLGAIEVYVWDQVGKSSILAGPWPPEPHYRRHAFYHVGDRWYNFGSDSFTPENKRKVWSMTEQEFSAFRASHSGEYRDGQEGVLWESTGWFLAPTPLEVGDVGAFKQVLDAAEASGEMIDGNCLSVINEFLRRNGLPPLRGIFEGPCQNEQADWYMGYLGLSPDVMPGKRLGRLCGNSSPQLYSHPVPPRTSWASTQPVQAVSSWDPNDKTAPMGFGEGRFVRSDEAIHYSIYFENVDSATAEAEDIVITDTLDSDLDWSTLVLKSIYPGAGPDSIRPNYVASTSFNSATGVITWTLTNINLPPDTAPYWGEGWVNYAVAPKLNLPTGARIENIAAIKFDENPWILAPMDSIPVFNTIDASSPFSQVLPLPEASTSPYFTVSWTGYDAAGSGINSYSIYCSDNYGPYLPWLVDTTSTSAQYSGQDTHTYRFYSIAKDNVGLVEELPLGGFDAQTTVVGCCGGTTGNVNMLGIVDVSDLSLLVAYLTSNPAPVLPCMAEANVNGLSIVDVSDLSLLVGYLTTSPAPNLPACP